MNNLEKLAVAQAVYKAVGAIVSTKDHDSLRGQIDAELIEQFEADGTDRKRLMLNGQEVGNKNFWLLHTENTSSMTVGNSKTKVAQIDWKQMVDVQRMGFMFTAEASLSATATVKILITVDDSASYEFEVTEQKAMYGRRVFTSTCGFRVTGKTTHSAKVYMTVTDTPTLWSDLI